MLVERRNESIARGVERAMFGGGEEARHEGGRYPTSWPPHGVLSASFARSVCARSSVGFRISW
jgi:hypothetical protein